MTLTSICLINQLAQGDKVYFEQCLKEFTQDPTSAEQYLLSKGVVSRWFLRHNIIGDCAKYAAAEKVIKSRKRAAY